MPFRSILIVPATRLATLPDLSGVDAGAVLLDLTATSHLSHEQRLDAATTLLRERPPGADPKLWVRLDPLDGAEIERDLAAVCPLAPDALVLPRAETAADVEHLGALLAVREAEAGLDDGALKIVAMVETAGAVFELHRLARASDRLIALGWDGEALGRDLGADEERELDGRWIDPLQTIRTLTLAACADAKLAAIDSPFTDADDEIFRKEAERAARDGFSAKFARSAEQAAIIDAVFASGDRGPA